MGLENVVNDILEQAKTEVSAIEAEAQDEAAAMIDKAKNKAEKILADSKTEVEANIQRRLKQEKSSAQLEIKRAALNAKKDVLDSVYQSAREAISSLAPDKNASMLKAILDEHGSDGSRVYSNARDAKLVRELTDLTFMAEIDCIGGLIIENDDGSVRLDYTFDRILDDVSEQTLKPVSDILFG
ncbi:MAG TPA: V-type ATP synthase subunit E [Methanosarcinales archaeon]|nr:V-type ATP synthase subunit E [Methanosarcinales archaeon]